MPNTTIVPGDAIFKCYELSFFDENNILIAKYFQSVETRGLRVQFRVRQQFFLINNIAEIKIFNLSLDSMHLISNAFRLTLSAGYGDDLKLIHNARIINLFVTREQPDYYLSIFTHDSFANQPPIQAYYPATMTDYQMITQLASDLPVVVKAANLQGVTNLPVGVAVAIPQMLYLDALQKLGEQLNLKIWVTNGVLYSSSLSPTTFTVTPDNSVTLNYQNGMIGSPTIDVANAGIVVKCMLKGAIVPGNYVIVETLAPQIELGLVNYYHFDQDKATRGEWRVMTVDHVGDTMGNDWYSEIRGYGLKLLSPS